MQKFLTVKDIMEILGVSSHAAYKIVNSADFPKIKVGRAIRIPPDAFQRWVEQKCGGTGNENNHN